MDSDFHLMPQFQFESPYLAEYFGIWSIYEPVFQAMAEKCKGINLFTHVKSSEVQQSVEARDDRTYGVTKDGIALFQIRGPMMKAVPSMADGTSTLRLRQQIRSARRDPEVRGAMAVFYTPGGTVAGNADLARDFASFAAQKPIYSFIEDMCASAGVAIASQTTKRFANDPESITGSMGTYGVAVDYSGNAEQLGIRVHVVRAGEFKGMGTAGSEISAAHLAEMQRVINAMNEGYLKLIASGLGRSVDSIRPLADGRAILGADAVAAGLINGVQSYEQTYAELVQVCNSSKPVVSSKPRSQIMADTNPASIAELKQKFPKSSAEWREKQLEANATLPEAAMSYATFVEEKAEADRQAHAKELETVRAQGKANAGSLGHKPIVANGSTQGASEYLEGGDAVEDFNNAVAKAAGPNPDMKRRHAAIRQVASAKPDLYQAYLLASNPGKRQRRIITEKLESVTAN